MSMIVWKLQLLLLLGESGVGAYSFVGLSTAGGIVPVDAGEDLPTEGMGD